MKDNHNNFELRPPMSASAKSTIECFIDDYIDRCIRAAEDCRAMGRERYRARKLVKSVEA